MNSSEDMAGLSVATEMGRGQLAWRAAGERMTGMSDLVAFLAARLDEDEAAAKRNTEAGLGDDGGPYLIWPDYQTYDSDDLDLAYEYLRRFRPTRMLREVAVKRAILGLCARIIEDDADPDGEAQGWSDGWPGLSVAQPTLRHLAAIYADRPDYAPAWVL